MLFTVYLLWPKLKYCPLSLLCEGPAGCESPSSPGLHRPWLHWGSVDHLQVSPSGLPSGHHLPMCDFTQGRGLHREDPLLTAEGQAEPSLWWMGWQGPHFVLKSGGDMRAKMKWPKQSLLPTLIQIVVGKKQSFFRHNVHLYNLHLYVAPCFSLLWPPADHI